MISSCFPFGLNLHASLCLVQVVLYIGKAQDRHGPIYTSAHGSGRRYYILVLKFLSFFFFRHRISEMALRTGNLSSSDGGI